jgi:hypothetical protein
VEALDLLAAASPTTKAALEAIRSSGLPVAIGTPAQLADLPERRGGLTAAEREALLAAPAASGRTGNAAVAWVMFRSVGADEHDGFIERVWLAIEADSVESWIRNGSGSGADERIRHDYLAILAHEFVAHVGSVAATRRIADLCDDPTSEQRSRSAAAAARGEVEPPDGDGSACSLQVENRVRSEVNTALAERGGALLPIRRSYALDTLNFERARRKLYPPTVQRLRPFATVRN